MKEQNHIFYFLRNYIKIDKCTKKYSSQEILHFFLICTNYEKGGEKAGKEPTWITF